MPEDASRELGDFLTLTRNCEATLIPYGTKVTLQAGEEVKITQALGGSYTLLIHGNLVRIEEKDIDAIGKTPPSHQTGIKKSSLKPVDETSVWDVIKTCYDPEIPVNIVDLGLVYSCELFPLEEGGTRIEVKMTLTSPGCGMGEPLSQEVKAKILDIPGVSDVIVDLVWDPPWNQEMMSDAAKLQLGMM